MRLHGTLTKWNDDRGFGFISPSKGPTEIFVHISAFPRAGGRPQLNELISFETEPGRDGRLRAVRVMRPARPRTAGTFCAEANYFLNHCPGTQMDGDGDGIPCESQFCR